jgi:glycosyltransferase involved in cell wall biosynthesis
MLPAELRGAAGPVVLFFGLLRPYKGLDVLLDAWRLAGVEAAGVAGAELWVVGMPRMDIAPLLAAAGASAAGAAGKAVAGAARGNRVRVLPRFVSDGEAHALLRRASLVVAPYREIDQSGVVLTALGAGRPLLLSDVGGFPELAATGAARTVPAGDPAALGAALEDLLGDPTALAEMAAGARAAAAGPYAWQAIAAAHLRLYAQLLSE